MAKQTLHGSCACGRNRYVVEIPVQQAQLAELRYDNTSASRKSLTNVLSGLRRLVSNITSSCPLEILRSHQSRD